MSLLIGDRSVTLISEASLLALSLSPRSSVESVDSSLALPFLDHISLPPARTRGQGVNIFRGVRSNVNFVILPLISVKCE